MESPDTHSTYQFTSNHLCEESNGSPKMQRQEAPAQKSRFFKEIDEAFSSDSSASTLSPLPFMNQDANMDFKVETPTL